MPRKKGSIYTIKTTSPILRDLFSKLNKTKEVQIADRAGINDTTAWRWRTGRHTPRLVEVESFLEAMGYRLVLAKIEPDLPPAKAWIGARPVSEVSSNSA